MNIDKLLEERGKTHGSFIVNSAIAQPLRDEFRAHGDAWRDMPYVAREALDHIAGKIGRVLSAPNLPDIEPDHFDDIAGYATLAANFLRAQRADLIEAADEFDKATQGEMPSYMKQDQIDALLAEHARQREAELPGSLHAKQSEPLAFDASC